MQLIRADTFADGKSFLRDAARLDRAIRVNRVPQVAVKTTKTVCLVAWLQSSPTRVNQ